MCRVSHVETPDYVDLSLQLQVRTNTPEVTISVIQELIRRGALRSALAGRDESSARLILKFLQKFVIRSFHVFFLLIEYLKLYKSIYEFNYFINVRLRLISLVVE